MSCVNVGQGPCLGGMGWLGLGDSEELSIPSLAPSLGLD